VEEYNDFLNELKNVKTLKKDGTVQTVSPQNTLAK
jgi:hypothetical protein